MVIDLVQDTICRGAAETRTQFRVLCHFRSLLKKRVLLGGENSTTHSYIIESLNKISCRWKSSRAPSRTNGITIDLKWSRCNA